MVFDGIEDVEDAVVEVLLAQLVPRMFDRIEFGRARRHTPMRPRRRLVLEHQPQRPALREAG
jgi:hypothetical protein